MTTFFFIACTKKERMMNIKYKIEGKSRVPKGHDILYTNRKDTIEVTSFWYTDTFNIVNDTIVIENTDGSCYRIAKPYKIYKVKNNRIYEKSI